MSDVKPCLNHSCNEILVKSIEKSGTRERVSCPCGMRGPWAINQNLAIEAWNSLSSTIDRQADMIGEIQEVLKSVVKERDFKEKVIQILCEGVHCNTCQCRNKCQAENEADFIMDAVCMNNRREWAIDKAITKETTDDQD